MMTLKEFEKKTKQKFPAMKQHGHNCKLIPMKEEGWENIWKCIKCNLHVVGHKL